MRVPDRLALWRGGMLLFLALVCLLFYWLHTMLSSMALR
jgi:hypothetical protein